MNDDSNYYSEDDNSRSSPTADVTMTNVDCDDDDVLRGENNPEGRRQQQKLLHHHLASSSHLRFDLGNLLYRGEGNSSLVVALKEVCLSCLS